jgi:hypothetical protein
MTGGCAGVAVRQAGDHIHIAIHMAIHEVAVLVWVGNRSRVHLRNDYDRARDVP